MAGSALYVCDLDGTLLRSDATLSEFAREGLNELIDAGVRRQCPRHRRDAHEASTAHLRRLSTLCGLPSPHRPAGACARWPDHSADHREEKVLPLRGVLQLIEPKGHARAIIYALVLLVALLAAPPADAARATIGEARGDASSPWDITRVVVNNGRKVLRIEVRHRGKLKLEPPKGLLTTIQIEVGYRTGSPYSHYLSPPPPPPPITTRFFSLSMLRGSNGAEAPNGARLSGDSGSVRCRGFRGKMRARLGLVLFLVPQRCLGASARRVRITGGSTYQPRGLPEEADYIRKQSRWIRRG